jgi:hypothetical protein
MHSSFSLKTSGSKERKIMTTRYLAFAGDNYYPGGGYFDLKASGDEKSLTDLIEQMKKLEPDWFHILDISTAKIVAICEGNFSANTRDGKIIMSPDCVIFEYDNPQWVMVSEEERQKIIGNNTK